MLYFRSSHYQIAIDESLIEENFIRASGPGGQNVNKVSSAVQLRFDAAHAGLPQAVYDKLIKLAGQRATKNGEIVLEANRFRTQERNRQDAMERLKALIEQAIAPPPPQRRKTKPSKGAMERRLKAKQNRGTIKKMRQSVRDD